MRVAKEAVAKLERQLGERVRGIRPDGGSEFSSGEAIEWFKTTGIQHYTSPRYTPELNGVAERIVRTLKEMTSTLLLDSRLPSEYWSYAARYAAVILMKTSNKDPSPWTRLTGRAGGIESLRRFGQRCFIQVPREVRRKNDLTIEKGEVGTLLGQSETVSGWNIQRDRETETERLLIRGTQDSSEGTPRRLLRTQWGIHRSRPVRAALIYLCRLLSAPHRCAAARSSCGAVNTATSRAC
jgi:hypothetical protein